MNLSSENVLYFGEQPMLDYLKTKENFKYMRGTTFSIIWFHKAFEDNRVGNIHIRGGPEKVVRADTFVLTESYYMIKFLIDMRVTPTLLRASTALFVDSAHLSEVTAMAGPCLNMLSTRQGVVGQS